MSDTGETPKSVIGHLREMSQIKLFPVEITETLQKTVMVRAASKDEAEQSVRDEYRAGIHILESDDFVDVAFTARDTAQERAAGPPMKNPDR